MFKMEADLNRFISTNKLPCFACMINDNEEEKQEIYLYRVFKAKYFRAKCYNSSLEHYMLNKRPSYVYLDVDTDTLKKNQQNIRPFNEIFIPFQYQGLFEIFSSNSFQLGGILDHETNVISFSSRVKNPMYYYVAKELSLYETVKLNSVTQRYKSMTSSINIFDKVNKKWKKFEEGTLLKAIKLDDVDYFLKKSSCHQLICCRFNAKNRFELAIEFKVVENFNELISKESVLDNSSNMKKKSYYLPVDSVENPDIDVIPIETCINKHLKLNSLQMIRNFSKLNLNENLINLKLFCQNAFSNNTKKVKSVSGDIDSELRSSIFELCEFNENADIVCGYNVKENRLFFAPLKCKTESNSVKFTKINDMKSKLLENFVTKLDEFKVAANLKISNFEIELNKVETFNLNSCTESNKTRSLSVKKKKIIHFSDLAMLGKSFSSDTLEIDAEKQAKKKRECFKRNKYYSFKTSSKEEPCDPSIQITRQDIDNLKDFSVKQPPTNARKPSLIKRSKSIDILV